MAKEEVKQEAQEPVKQEKQIFNLVLYVKGIEKEVFSAECDADYIQKLFIQVNDKNAPEFIQIGGIIMNRTDISRIVYYVKKKEMLQ